MDEDKPSFIPRSRDVGVNQMDMNMVSPVAE